jgi:hypothetical protein
MKSPVEFVPLLFAGVFGMGLTIALVTVLDNSNTKYSTYALLGFLAGIGVQIGVRVTGVS